MMSKWKDFPVIVAANLAVFIYKGGRLWLAMVEKISRDGDKIMVHFRLMMSTQDALRNCDRVEDTVSLNEFGGTSRQLGRR